MGKFFVAVCAFACYLEAARRSIDGAPWYVPLSFTGAAGVLSTFIAVIESREKADKK
jgi:hypothetical protein